MKDETKQKDEALERLATPRAAQPLVVREAEPIPSYSVEKADIDYKSALEKFREKALFIEGVRKAAMAATRPHHWLSRRQKNGAVTYSLMGPGAERIRLLIPFGYENRARREEKWNKESGPGYTIYYESDVFLQSPQAGLMPVLGSCSSDDQFFATEHIELQYSENNPEHKTAVESGDGRVSNDGKTLYIQRQIPASEVSRENIEKSALTNWLVNAITRLLGIRSVSAEELQEAGIDIGKIPGFEYGSAKAASGKLSPAEEQKRDEIKKMLLEMNMGDEAKALAELRSRTAFNDYKGCESWERLTEKQVKMHHERVKADYNAFREGAPQQPSAQSKPPQGGAQKGQGKLL